MAYAEGVQHILFTLWHESTEEITNQQAATSIYQEWGPALMCKTLQTLSAQNNPSTISLRHGSVMGG